MTADERRNLVSHKIQHLIREVESELDWVKEIPRPLAPNAGVTVDKYEMVLIKLRELAIQALGEFALL